MTYKNLQQCLADQKTIDYIEESLENIRRLRAGMKCYRSAWDSLEAKELLYSVKLAVEYIKVINKASNLSSREREFVSSIVSQAIVKRLKDEN